MAKIKTIVYLKELSTQANQVTQLAKNDFGRLTEKQINWKQTPQIWSVAECLEHLNFYSRFYLPVFQKVINNSNPNKKPKENYSPGWLGNYFAYIMAPDMNTGRPRKVMNAPEKSNPMTTMPEKIFKMDTVFEFIKHSEDLTKIIQSSNTINLHKLVPTSLSRFLYLQIGDAYRVVLFHNIRHVLQAQRVIKRMLEKR